MFSYPFEQVMARTNKGQTPLHVAVEMAEGQWLNRDYDYGLTIKLLLGAGTLINTQDGLQNTPLQVRWGLKEVVICSSVPLFQKLPQTMVS